MIMEVSPAGRGRLPLSFTPNSMGDSISVVEDTVGLPVAGNKDWRGNSTWKEKLACWTGGTTWVCKRNGRESL